jgi:hypothetical protein
VEEFIYVTIGVSVCNSRTSRVVALRTLYRHDKADSCTLSSVTPTNVTLVETLNVE